MSELARVHRLIPPELMLTDRFQPEFLHCFVRTTQNNATGDDATSEVGVSAIDTSSHAAD